MPGSQQYRLRLSPLLAHEVPALAELWGAPIAAVLRVAVEYAMQEPDKMHARLAERYGARVESATLSSKKRVSAPGKPGAWASGILLADKHRPLPY